MRWILRSVLALVLLAGVAVASVFFIPAEKIAGIAASKFNALTGRTLVISGSVRPSFWPQLGVKTGPISISNADWSKEGPMLTAEGLAITLDLQALIGGDMKITGIEAIAPRIILERSAKGQENWAFVGTVDEATGTDPAAVAEGKPFTLDKALISDGSLTYVDHGTGARFALEQVAAEVSIPDFNGAARIDLSGVTHGQAFKLGGTVAAFRDFLDGSVVGSDVSLRAGDADVVFKGRAGWGGMEAEGDVTARLGDLTAIAALAGVAAPELPEGMGARSVQVAGALTVTSKGSVHLRSGRIKLDSNALAADVDLTTDGDRPKVSAKVVAGMLNFAGMTKGAGGDAGAAAQGAGWPKARIDVSALSAMDAAISISAKGLDLGAVALGSTQAMVTIDRSRMVVDLARVAGYGGAITGQAVVNGRRGLSVGGDLSFDGMDLQALLRDLAGYERLLGRGDFRLKYLASGNSVDAIMRDLEGSGSFALRRGAIVGLDIGGMLRRLDTSYVGDGQKTIFDGLTGSYTINAGVWHNEDLLLKSSDLTAQGTGDIDLGKQQLRYRVKAIALADEAGQGGLTVPLLIEGPWAKPRFSLDLQAIADQRIEEEKAKLEAALKEKAAAQKAELQAKAKEKLQNELGITQQEGESLEDAARRRANEVLGEEAAKALQNLLGGN